MHVLFPINPPNWLKIVTNVLLFNAKHKSIVQLDGKLSITFFYYYSVFFLFFFTASYAGYRF